MEIPLYQVHSFSASVWGGNPAAVCPLEKWLPDATLQSIALENNLSETAFFLRGAFDGSNTEKDCRLRWFTPTVEAQLCGHATLASAWVIFKFLNPEAQDLIFDSLSGPLGVTREEDRIVLDFPTRELKSNPALIPEVAECLGAQPFEVFEMAEGSARGWRVVMFETESQILALRPNFALMTTANEDIIVTAPGTDCDYVLRCFAPRDGIPEDPVTGSAQCYVAPLWAARLRKQKFFSRQLSIRRGEIWTELKGNRTLISGRTALYLQGKIFV